MAIMRTLLFTLTILFTATAVAQASYGVYIAPKKVIADIQSVWTAVHLNNCPHRSQHTEESDQHYCDITWDLHPDNVVFSDDKRIASVDSLPEGHHVFSGAINRYDPKHHGLVESEPFREVIVAETIDVGFIMKGLPLDPFGENNVYIESETHREHKCVFYAGAPVPTPVEKIEEGKVYCRINWINVPEGFELLRRTNPTLFTGNLKYRESENPSDYTFTYEVTAHLPYEKVHTFGTFNVNAAKNVVNAPRAKLDENYDDFFFKSLSDPNLPLRLSIANDYSESMVLSIVRTSNNEEVHSSVHENGSIIDDLLDISSQLETPGTFDEYTLKVAYENKISSHFEKSIVVVNSGQENPIKIDSIRTDPLAVHIDVSQADPATGGTYRIYLAEITDQLLFQNANAKSTRLYQPQTIGDIIWTSGKPATIEVPVARLGHTRYMVVSELIGFDGQSLHVLRRELSDPIVSTLLSERFNHRTVSDTVAPSGSWWIVNTLDPKPHPLEFKFSDETSVAKYANNVYRFTNDGTGQVAIPGKPHTSTKLTIYSIEEFSLVASNLYPAPNQDTVFYVRNDIGEQVDGSEHTIYWYVDGEPWGTMPSFATTFDEIGRYKVEAYVSYDLFKDTPMLAGKMLDTEVHVALAD
ncbi:MAG: hypothetical protein C9356_12305 [Oleiphilus sp.]|nr:MAG: hypothetical protein C9356_12305 [Oleiphilus sp.]